MIKNLNSELNKKDKFTCEVSRLEVEESPGAVGSGTCGGGPYGE
jgi:hypothetical protein